MTVPSVGSRERRRANGGELVVLLQSDKPAREEDELGLEGLSGPPSSPSSTDT